MFESLKKKRKTWKVISLGSGVSEICLEVTDVLKVVYCRQGVGFIFRKEH